MNALEPWEVAALLVGGFVAYHLPSLIWDRARKLHWIFGWHYAVLYYPPAGSDLLFLRVKQTPQGLFVKVNGKSVELLEKGVCWGLPPEYSWRAMTWDDLNPQPDDPHPRTRQEAEEEEEEACHDGQQKG